jgi:ABC-2 type transport system permease protein
MSVVEAVGPPPGPARTRPGRPSTRLLRSELRLIFGRRRNQAGLGVLISVPIIVGIVLRVSGGAEDGPPFLVDVTSNGLFLALVALNLELGLFLPLAVAAISADAVAGEANTGTLRYLLTVPVARTRLLAVKYAAVVIFAFVAATLVAVVGVVVGLLLFGGGPITLLSGTQVSFGDALVRLAAIVAYLAVGLSALGAVGVFASTLTEQPIGTTIAVVVFTVASFILDEIPQLEWLHPYLIVHWWLAFGDLLRDPVAWDGIGNGLLSAGAYVVVFLTAAWARFAGRDITS